MLYQAASHALKMAATHGGMIQHNILLLLNYNVPEISQVDLLGFHSPWIISRDQLSPGMFLSVGKITLYVIELSLGFETKLKCQRREGTR